MGEPELIKCEPVWQPETEPLFLPESPEPSDNPVDITVEPDLVFPDPNSDEVTNEANDEEEELQEVKLESPVEKGKTRKRLSTNAKKSSRTKKLNKRGPHPCPVCGSTFTQVGSLNRHLLVHLGRRPFSCSQCEKTFTRRAHLESHMSVHSRNRSFPCSQCERTFTKQEYLQEHLVAHSEDKSFSCSLCGRSFTTTTTLKNHMMIHTGVKPYSCPTCGKTFSRSGNLSVHMLIHTGERPHACEVCGKSFAHKATLKSHRVVHYEEKPYACSFCHKRFTRRDTMLTHEYIHTSGIKRSRSSQLPPDALVIQPISVMESITSNNSKSPDEGEKSDSCSKKKTKRSSRKNADESMRCSSEEPCHEDCDETLSSPSSLMNNLSVQTKEKPFNCVTCGECFDSKDILSTHECSNVKVKAESSSS